LRDEAGNISSKLAEIRLSINHPQNQDKVFVLLEGRTDIKLFRKIFSHKFTDTTALDGKDKLVEALTTLHSENFRQVIGIKDADFEHLENIINIDNLFLTDYHDMEIEMIESDALKSVIDEFSIDECYSDLSNQLRQNIYDIALEIGYIRWYSEQKNGLFNFKQIPFNNLVSYKNCKISFNQQEFIALLLNQLKSDDSDILADITILKNISTDRLQICNGHDLTLLISNYFPTGNINQNKIEEALRLSYHFQYFKKTNLFQNLKSWAELNGYNFFDID
jgi:hypothetical protein